MLAGIAADTDRTNELNDSGEETIIKSQLDTDSVITRRDPAAGQGTHILPYATTNKLERS